MTTITYPNKRGSNWREEKTEWEKKLNYYREPCHKQLSNNKRIYLLIYPIEIMLEIINHIHVSCTRDTVSRCRWLHSSISEGDAGPNEINAQFTPTSSSSSTAFWLDLIWTYKSLTSALFYSCERNSLSFLGPTSLSPLMKITINNSCVYRIHTILHVVQRARRCDVLTMTNHASGGGVG